MENKPLTPKQQLFVDLYLANGYNATKAYKEAGYRYKSDGAARTMASQLLAKPDISVLIRTKESDLLKSLQEKTKIDRERVIRELLEIVETASTVSAVKVEGKAVVLWQPNAAVRALELLGKEIGMFVERNADVTETLREREQQLELLKKAMLIVKREEERDKTQGEAGKESSN